MADSDGQTSPPPAMAEDEPTIVVVGNAHPQQVSTNPSRAAAGRDARGKSYVIMKWDAEARYVLAMAGALLVVRRGVVSLCCVAAC